MYTFDSRIRYSEIDRSGRLSIPAVVDYFQDCSAFQSEELGVDVRECSGFDEAALPIQHADNMQHAVELARAAAKPGDIIILSPASASFDLYPNFEVRGREFKKIVNALK